MGKYRFICKVFPFLFFACRVFHVCNNNHNQSTTTTIKHRPNAHKTAKPDAYTHDLPLVLCGHLSKLAHTFDRQTKPRDTDRRRPGFLPPQIAPRNHETPHKNGRQKMICISKNDKKDPTPHQKRPPRGNDPLKNSRHNFSSDFFLQDFF